MEEVPIKVVCYLDTLVSGLFQKRGVDSEVVFVQLREHLQQRGPMGGELASMVSSSEVADWNRDHRLGRLVDRLYLLMVDKMLNQHAS